MTTYSPSMLILSYRDPRSIGTWSGTPHFMTAALERRCARVVTAPISTPFSRLRLTALRKLQKLTNKGSALGFQTLSFSRYATRRLRALLAADRFDVVLCPLGSSIVPGVPPGVPVIYTCDATFRLLRQYYSNFSGLNRSAVEEAEELERAAIARADLLVYPTQWAAQSAIDDYGADPARIRIARYGANIPAAPDPSRLLRSPEAGKPFRMLFVGVNWNRKGGPIVLDAFRRLRSRGLNVELTILGCTPPDPTPEPGLKLIPFVNKSDPAQYQTMLNAYIEADLFVLPSRSECYGIVFCEAAAYGLPCMAPNTGGVPEVVRDGESGVILPVDAGGESYAEAIAGLMADPARLSEMRRKSRHLYDTELNWDVWAGKVVEFAAALAPGARVRG